MRQLTLVFLLLVTSAALAVNSPAQQNAGNKTRHAQAASRTRAALDPAKLLDLTHPFDDQAVYWPTAQGWHWEKESWGMSPGGYWYTAGRFAASEHGGTHVDAPIHFGEGKQTLDQLTLSQLVAPAEVIDITKSCEGNPDYQLSKDDLTAWEKQHGQIPERSIVLIRTGWEQFWPDKKKYLGSDTAGDTAHLHFPGISREAAELLVQRKIAGVGLDTASLDHGQSKDFIAHRILNGANIYGLENVANMTRLPATGATVIALPVMIKGGTGGPVRIVAVLP